MRPIRNLRGEVYGGWRVEERVGTGPNGHALWRCCCTRCGAERELERPHRAAPRCGCRRQALAAHAPSASRNKPTMPTGGRVPDHLRGIFDL